MGHTSRYRDLARELLSVKRLEEAPLLLPDMFGDPPRVNIGDLTDSQDQKLCFEVCDRTDMTPAHWEALNESDRILWMEGAVAKGATLIPSQTAPADDEPPDTLMAELSGREQEIVAYVWNRGKATLDELKEHLTDKPRSDKAFMKSVYRLEAKLRRLSPSTKFCRRRDCVYLLRHDSTGQ